MTSERILTLCLARQSADLAEVESANAELKRSMPRLAGELVAERLRADALASAAVLLLTSQSEARDAEIDHHVRRFGPAQRKVWAVLQGLRNRG